MALPARILLKQEDIPRRARETFLRLVEVTGINNGTNLSDTAVWPQMGQPFMLLFARNRKPKAGHTLRLLKLPQLFLSHMEAATKFYMSMYSYLEKLKEAVTLKASRRSLLEIINGWRELSQHIADFIRDGERTKYLIVTIPEALGLKLTERMVTELASDGMDVGNIVINYVVKDDDCVFHAQRRAMQQRYISIIRDTYPDTNLVTLYLEPQEVRGRQRIEEVAYALFDGV